MEDSLQEYQKRMAKIRRIQSQASATLKRAQKAGIPDKYMRISETEFKNLLSLEYYKSQNKINKLSAIIYNKAKLLEQKPFIIIDGGEAYTRKQAGCAILFRLIACDMENCRYEDCNKLTHYLYSSRALGIEGRQNFSDYLKGLDVLFISECHESLFNPHFEAGSFFDEILGYREDYNKTTILSFCQPLPSQEIINIQSKSDTDYGQYMARISKADLKRMPTVLRIRVGGSL